MKENISQFISLLGASIAVACCLGAPLILSAVGLGFLVHDAYLFPIFVGFISLSLWILYRSANKHETVSPVASLPFWLSTIGALFSIVGLWFTVTGLDPQVWAIYFGLGLFIMGTVWDFNIGRQAKVCAEAACEVESQMEEPSENKIDSERRQLSGVAMSVAAAGIFYGLYKSVEVYTPEAKEGDITCWGINGCKGTTGF